MEKKDGDFKNSRSRMIALFSRGHAYCSFGFLLSNYIAFLNWIISVPEEYMSSGTII